MRSGKEPELGREPTSFAAGSVESTRPAARRHAHA